MSTIGQKLRLGSGGDQLGIEKLTPEPAVERLGQAILPWGSRLDVNLSGDGAGLTPVPKGLGLAEPGHPYSQAEARAY
mgnify:FL=1